MPPVNPPAALNRTVLLFGAPGVGKGTQGKLLGAIPGFIHMAPGDIFRALDKRSPLGKKFADFSSKGLLVPDEVTVAVWKDHVARQIASGRYSPDVHLLVLDGIPRTLSQARAMAGHIDVLRIVHLRPPSVEDMVERLKKRALEQGRRDDGDEAVIRRRFEVYENETAPVLECYPKSLVTEVSAVGQPAEVLLEILSAIVPVYAGRFGNPLDG